MAQEICLWIRNCSDQIGRWSRSVDPFRCNKCRSQHVYTFELNMATLKVQCQRIFICMKHLGMRCYTYIYIALLNDFKRQHQVRILCHPPQLTGEDWHPEWVGMRPFFLQLKHPIDDGLGSGESIKILPICRSYMIFIPVICLSDTFLFLRLRCYKLFFCWLSRRKKTVPWSSESSPGMGITPSYPLKSNCQGSEIWGPEKPGWKKWRPNGRRVGLFGQLSPLKRPSNATPMKRRRKKSFVISCWGRNG